MLMMANISPLNDKWLRHKLYSNTMKLNNPKKKRPPRKLILTAPYYKNFPNSNCNKVRSLNIITHIIEETTLLLIMFNNG